MPPKHPKPKPKPKPPAAAKPPAKPAAKPAAKPPASPAEAVVDRYLDYYASPRLVPIPGIDDGDVPAAARALEDAVALVSDQETARAVLAACVGKLGDRDKWGYSSLRFAVVALVRASGIRPHVLRASVTLQETVLRRLAALGEFLHSDTARRVAKELGAPSDSAGMVAWWHALDPTQPAPTGFRTNLAQQAETAAFRVGEEMVMIDSFAKSGPLTMGGYGDQLRELTVREVVMLTQALCFDGTRPNTEARDRASAPFRTLRELLEATRRAWNAGPGYRVMDIKPVADYRLDGWTPNYDDHSALQPSVYGDTTQTGHGYAERKAAEDALEAHEEALKEVAQLRQGMAMPLATTGLEGITLPVDRYMGSVEPDTRKPSPIYLKPLLEPLLQAATALANPDFADMLGHRLQAEPPSGWGAAKWALKRIPDGYTELAGGKRARPNPPGAVLSATFAFA